MDVNVFMIGGRRCGKTTILSALQQQTNDVFKGEISLLAYSQTDVNILTEKRSEAEDYFNFKTPNKLPSPDDTPTPDQCGYRFSLRISGKNKSNLSISFTDVPGEWFNLDAEKRDKIDANINNSEILMIAIDTPYLMENWNDFLKFGQNHDDYNKATEITEYIKHMDISKLRNRMILFVPVKCEKYYHEGRMQEVADAVKAGYQDLIAYLQSPSLSGCCTVAIVPILSLGGMAFHRFEVLESGYLKQRYRYYPNYETAAYTPKYCEQPIMYALLFELKMAVQRGVNKGFGIWLSNLFGANIATNADFQKLLTTIQAAIVSNRPDEGFVTVQDPFKIL